MAATRDEIERIIRFTLDVVNRDIAGPPPNWNLHDKPATFTEIAQFLAGEYEKVGRP